MRVAASILVAASLCSEAAANGRDPYTVSLSFRQGSTQDIIAGNTFGLTVSHDGGATWHWMCETAIGYGGMYDPDYIYTANGHVFATTFDGLRAMSDGCTFNATPPGMTFVSRVELGPDGAIYFAAADSMDSKIYKSVDGGATFPISATPGINNDWWQSIMIAPSDASRVYVTGYRLSLRCTQNSSNPGAACTSSTQCPGGACENQKQFLLFRSDDGGASYTPMTMTGIGTTSQNSTIDLVGVSPTAPDTLYVKVTLETGNDGDTIYKSTNAGATWTPLLSKSSRFGLAFLARADGTCLAGTRDLGMWRSTGCDATWTDVVGAPHIGCLYERGNEVWACTQNYASPQLGITSDEFGIMKSTDLVTWTGVLKYQDIAGPVSCPGTIQEQRCVERYMGQQSGWCCLIAQLGITSKVVDCSGPMACFGVLPEGLVDAPTVTKPPPSCCGAGSGTSAVCALIVLVALGLPRRRPKER